MKSSKGFKRFLFICAGIICVGVVFAGIGFMLGGVPYLNYESGEGFVSAKATGNIFSGRSEIAKEDLGSFTDIKIYAGASNIYFVESDKFAVEYCYDDKLGKPEVSVVNDALVYRDRLYDIRHDSDWWRAIRKAKTPLYVTVYYPEGTNFNSVYVDSDMGDFKIDGLNTARLESSMDVGEIDFERVNALHLEVDSDVGDIHIKNAVLESSDVSTDTGDISIGGELRGYNNISSDVGDISIKSTLTMMDYNYDIEVDLGEVTVDGMSVKRSYLQNNGAPNSFELENSIGDIDIRFQ